MDLHAVQAVVRPRTRAGIPPWQPGDVLLAGGTALFSEPQPGARRLVDLHALGWAPLEVLESPGQGVRIAATCTLEQVMAAQLDAAGVIAGCCEALSASFKVRHTATVGGNLCWALPAAPMLAALVALDGVAVVWTAAGERTVPMDAFVTGPGQTVLAPGEVLRAVDVPGEALQRRGGVRQASLTAQGRSAVLLAATAGASGFVLAVTGSTVRPVALRWAAAPAAGVLEGAISALPDALWLRDVHGDLAWRQHMTRRLAAELLGQLA